MKNKLNHILILKLLLGGIFVLLTFGLRAQESSFKYFRELSSDDGLSGWRSLELPQDIDQFIKKDYADIRVLGRSDKGDTVEVPYIFKTLVDKVAVKEAPFKRINRSKSKGVHYYTFYLEDEVLINQVNLYFKRDNFDWHIKLEGSQDRKSWFTLQDQYRIVSIKNELTDYRFTKITFPDAKYQYYRLAVDANKDPKLKDATISRRLSVEGKYRDFTVETFSVEQEKKKKQTIIDFSLKEPVAVSYMKFDVLDTVDYYRPALITYAADSFQTPEGKWMYNYKRLRRGTLSSLEDNEFFFGNTISYRFRATIFNYDNEPLNITGVNLKGNVHTMEVRFPDPSYQYFLVYGKDNARKPRYDVEIFKEKVPTDLSVVKLGKHQDMVVATKEKVHPIFESEYWLWGIMLVIIGLLGWFTIKMIGQKSSEA